MIPAAKLADANLAASLAGIQGDLFEATRGLVPSGGREDATATVLWTSVPMTVFQERDLRKGLKVLGVDLAAEYECTDVDQKRPEKTREAMDSYKSRKNLKDRKPVTASDPR